MRILIFSYFALLLMLSMPKAYATEETLDGIPPSVQIAEGFDFVPVTNTVREVRDLFNQNGGTVSDFALVGPTVMAAPPGVDGHLFIGTQRGQIFHVAFDRDENDHPVFSSMELMLDIRDKVSAAIDRGLIGMAVHPDFEEGTGRLYLSYTHANGDLDGYYETTCFDEILGAQPCTEVKQKTAGLAWYQIDDYVGDPDSEQLILGKVRGTPAAPSCSDYAENADCIYSDSGSHTVGGVAFDPETGAVCLATGDGAGFYQAEPDAVRAARLDNLSGKLLCVDPDTGLGLASNPYWTGDPNDFASRTVVYGLRNPYRFTFSDEGDLVIYMVGWNQVESAYRVSARTGGYAGWPCHGVETYVTDYQFLDACQFDAPEPVLTAQYQYDHLPENDYQAAIVGAAQFGPTYPQWLEGHFLAGDYRNDWVRVLGTDEDTGLWVDELDLAYGTDPGNPIELGAPVMFYNDSAGRVYMMSFLSGTVDGFNIGTIYEITYTSPVDRAEQVAGVSEQAPMTVAGFDFEPIRGHLNFSFDCSESTVGGLSIADSDDTQCRWDFQDGSPDTESRDVVTHEFPAVGNYEVTLSLIDEAGEVLARAIRDVLVTDPQLEAFPFISDVQLPDRVLAISESFDIGVSVINSGEEEPFCATLSVTDQETDNTIREIRRCTTLPTDAEATLVFPLFFSDPGSFTLAVRFHATTSDLPAAEPTAYLGLHLIGTLGIQNRSGLTEPLPDIDGDTLANNDDALDSEGAADDSVTADNSGFDVASDSQGSGGTDTVIDGIASNTGGSSGGGASVWLLLLLCLPRLCELWQSGRRA